MSRYHAIRRRPETWVSAHRKCEFSFSIPNRMAFGGYDSGGYLGILMTNTFGYKVPEVGDRLFVYDGTYYGMHTITTVVSSIEFVTSTVWLGAMYNEQVGLVALPTMKLYKGYAVGELIVDGIDLSEWQPRTLIAEFKPECGTDGYITFDISGYLKTAIEIPRYGFNSDEENKQIEIATNQTLIPTNYNKVELICDSNLEQVLYVANSAYTMEELTRYFVDTDRPLNKVNLEFTGKSINTKDYITELTQVRHGS